MERNRTLDLLKWFAVTWMILSHLLYAYYDGYENSLLRYITQGGYPLFALMWTYSSKLATWNNKRYVNLFTWAILAQLPFTLLFGYKLNILFAFLFAALPLSIGIPLACAFGPITAGGILGCFMLIFARRATLPELPTTALKIPKAKMFTQIYAGHLAVICWALILFPH